MNIEQFLEQHADADGNVSDADMAKLLAGGHEGDTAAGQPAESGVPAASSVVDPAASPAAGSTASQPEPGPAKDPEPATPPAGEATPVILAKDGVHTIDYQKLVDAREAERAAKARADELLAEVETLRAKATAAPPASAAPVAVDGAAAPAASVFGDYSDEAIKKGMESITAAAVGKSKADLDAELAPLKQHLAAQTAEAHFNTIHAKHPDLESVVESTEFNRWVDAQPSFVRDAYKGVLDKGTATQVVEMLDSYKAAHPAKPAATPAPAAAANVDAQVEKAIANAKSKVPSSLSDLPAGAAAQHDEVAAMAELSTMDLMKKFAGKTPAEIEAMVSKLV